MMRSETMASVAQLQRRLDKLTGTPDPKPKYLGRFTHGKETAYRYGCRCVPCRQANAEKVMAARLSRTLRLKLDPTLAPHGVANTYNNWGCRCIPCGVAFNAQRRQYP